MADPGGEPMTPRPERSLSLRAWAAGAATASVALLAGVTWLAVESLPALEQAQRDVAHLAADSADVRHLDEVLTMSAQMAAATGEAAWQTRYDRHAGELDEAIASLRERSREVLGQDLGSDVQQANERLVEAETAAFARVNAGDLPGARALLNADGYWRDKGVYAAGLAEAKAAAAEHAVGMFDRARSDAALLSAGCVAALGIAALGWSRTLAEMTALRRRERSVTLAFAQARAEAAETAMKFRFLANVRHEFRTPLTAVLGFAEMAADEGCEPAEREEFVGHMRRGAKQLTALLDDVLEVAVDGPTRPVRVRQPTPLNDLLDSAVAAAESAAGTKPIEVTSREQGDLPTGFATDRDRLGRALWHLACNAGRYTERGRIEIIASATAGELRLSVRDTGPGLPAEMLAASGPTLRQGDDSLTRRHAGLGIGLTVVRRIAASLGGRLELFSTSGEGTSATICVPLVAEDWEAADGPEATARAMAATSGVRSALPAPGGGAAANVPAGPAVVPVAPASTVPLAPPVSAVTAAAAPAAAALPEGGAAGPGRGPRVLVAEDTELTRDLVVAMLEALEARPVTATNGAEALSAIEHAAAEGDPIDLVLMDMQMPVVDGYTATRRLRALGVRTPVVACTAHASLEDEAVCRAAGCDGFMSKPLDVATLEAVLRHYTAGRAGGPGQRAA